MNRKTAQKKASAGAQCSTVAVRPRLLPLKAAAAFLGLTPWALRERAWAGQIPVVTWPGGRKWFFDTVDLEKFIQQHKRVIA
jgi:hypothetical protein